MSTSSDFCSSTDEVVTTIYVNGFPDDFKERELANMFIFAKGFEGCSLRIPNENDVNNSLIRCLTGTAKGQILGFVRFTTVMDSMDAIALLNGRVIDPDRGTTLKAELAKKNLVISQLRSSRSSQSCFPSDSASSRDSLFGPSLTRRFSVPSTSGEVERSLSLSIPGIPGPISVTAPSSNPQYLHHQEQSKTGSCLLNGNHRNINNIFSTSPSTLSNYQTENPPCNTLYVGNLPSNANEGEIRSVFCLMPGFRRLSFKTKVGGGSPMCFVEFEDIKTATHALETLYGTMLSNSVKGGIRLSYSKNPLGVKPLGLVYANPNGSNMYSGTFSPFNDYFSGKDQLLGGLATLEANHLHTS